MRSRRAAGEHRPQAFTFSFWSKSIALVALGLLALAVVRDQLNGATGDLEAEEPQSQRAIVGRYAIGWHRLRLGLSGDGPSLDPRSVTVVGHVDLGGRRLDFHSGRVRFGAVNRADDAVGNWGSMQSLLAEARCSQDSAFAVVVELDRTVISKPVTFTLGNRGGGNSVFQGLARERHLALRVTLKRLENDGRWVILARNYQSV